MLHSTVAEKLVSVGIDVQTIKSWNNWDELNIDPIHYIQLACLIASSFCYFMANDFINSMFFLCSILIWFRFSLDLMLRSCSNRSRDHHLSKSSHYEEKCYWKFIFGKIKYLHRNWSHRRRDHFSTSIKNLDRNLFSWSMTTFTY